MAGVLVRTVAIGAAIATPEIRGVLGLDAHPAKKSPQSSPSPAGPVKTPVESTAIPRYSGPFATLTHESGYRIRVQISGGTRDWFAATTLGFLDDDDYACIDATSGPAVTVHYADDADNYDLNLQPGDMMGIIPGENVVTAGRNNETRPDPTFRRGIDTKPGLCTEEWTRPDPPETPRP